MFNIYLPEFCLPILMSTSKEYTHIHNLNQYRSRRVCIRGYQDVFINYSLPSKKAYMELMIDIDDAILDCRDSKKDYELSKKGLMVQNVYDYIYHMKNTLEEDITEVIEEYE